MNAIVKPENQQIAPVDQATSILGLIGQASKDPNVNMDKMERLWAMYKEETGRQAKTKFYAAMGEAQSEMRPVLATATNDQTRKKYASYVDLDNAIRPIYTKHGFALSFDTGDGAPQDWVRVLCTISHRDGHSEVRHIDIPADGKGAKGGDVMTKTHAVMSATSYGKRGLLNLIFNIASGEFDDDGNGAGRKPEDLITEHEAANIQALIEETKANKKAFLEFFKIDSVEHLPKAKLKQATEMLEKRRNSK